MERGRGTGRLAAAGLAVLLGGLANAGLSYVNMGLDSPLFMDSIATAVVAALFGPWAGMASAIVTHLAMEATRGFPGSFLPFVVCNMATGLIVGLLCRGVRHDDVARAVLCVILVTFANAVLGTFVAVAFFRGIPGHATDYLVASFIAAGSSLVSAAFWARIPVNLIDKGIAVAFAILALWLRERRKRLSEERADRRF